MVGYIYTALTTNKTSVRWLYNAISRAPCKKAGTFQKLKSRCFNDRLRVASQVELRPHVLQAFWRESALEHSRFIAACSMHAACLSQLSPEVTCHVTRLFEGLPSILWKTSRLIAGIPSYTSKHRFCAEGRQIGLAAKFAIFSETQSMLSPLRAIYTYERLLLREHVVRIIPTNIQIDGAPEAVRLPEIWL